MHRMPELRQLCANGSVAILKRSSWTEWIERLKKCVAVNGDYVEK